MGGPLGVNYRAFHGFGQAKFAYGRSVRLEPIFNTTPAALKILLDSKVLKINPKIIIALRLSKSMTYSVKMK